MKLNKLALSLTLSAISGAVTLILTVWHVLDGFAGDFIRAFVSCHPTVFARDEAVGFVLVNTGYALIDGFIIGYLIALLYNALAARLGRDGQDAQSGPDGEKSGE